MTGVRSEPVVGHAMRAYLAPSETFVHNQIASLHRYRPVVVAQYRRPATEADLGEVIAREALPAPLALADRAAYRIGRVALPPGVDALARYLCDQRARLLHFHYLTDARFLLRLQRRTGLPAVASAYGYDVTEFPRQYRGFGLRYLRPVFDRLDRILAMSEDMRADLIALGCPPAKVQVHYHGSPTTRFRHDGRSYEDSGAPLTVLCCSRLEPYKGHHLTLAALRRLETAGRDGFRVVIVGEGSSRPHLERMAAAFGWGRRVTFAGHVPHASAALVRLYHDADVFVQPSYTLHGLKEGIPGTVVEAMAAGLPVVSTRHAGIPAVIESGTHGLLVPEQDVDALADALEAVFADEALRARIGRAAAERAARELDLGARTAALERIYDALI